MLRSRSATIARNVTATIFFGGHFGVHGKTGAQGTAKQDSKESGNDLLDFHGHLLLKRNLQHQRGNTGGLLRRRAYSKGCDPAVTVNRYLQRPQSPDHVRSGTSRHPATTENPPEVFLEGSPCCSRKRRERKIGKQKASTCFRTWRENADQVEGGSGAQLRSV